MPDFPVFPVPTESESPLQQLRSEGFTVLKNAVDAALCKTTRQMLERDATQLDGKEANVCSFHGTSSKQVYNLHNKGSEFLELISHPEILKVIGPALQEFSFGAAEPFILQSSTARCALPGCDAQQLHIDSRLPGLPHPVMVVAIIPLDRFSAETGGTRLVPGTYQNFHYAGTNEQHPKEIVPSVDVGDVMLINGGLWHGGGANMSPHPRWAIINAYSRWMFKPSFDFTQNTPMEIYDTLSSLEKQLLGFDTHPPRSESERISRRASEFSLPSLCSRDL